MPEAGCGARGIRRASDPRPAPRPGRHFGWAPSRRNLGMAGRQSNCRTLGLRVQTRLQSGRMRAALFHEHGGPDVIRVEEIERPTPGAGEVLVEVRAAALNHLDLWVRRGLPIESTMPHIGGSDAAGIVVELGSDVRDARVGERVVVDPSLSCGECEWCRRGENSVCTSYRILGEHTQGGFAEYVVVPAANLYRIPETVDFTTAAAAPLAFLTAWRALATRARLRAGESVLVTGASGGVATAAIQIARHLGARTYAVTTGEHVERVRALGADVVYDRLAGDYARELWRNTEKRGVD